MVAASYSETLVTTCDTARYLNPEHLSVDMYTHMYVCFSSKYLREIEVVSRLCVSPTMTD
jgi:hypothetical protein